MIAVIHALLAKYSISEIVIFVVALLLALKEAVTFFDWAKNRLRQGYEEEAAEDGVIEELRNEVNELKLHMEYQKEREEKIDGTFAKIDQALQMLIESDKEGIKAYITERHHHFVYERGWIDDYSLECLERRFAVYTQEHGNSFVEGLMLEIRALPRQPSGEDATRYGNTKQYVAYANDCKL